MRVYKEFADPFRMNNGKRVKDLRDWDERKEEIKKMILEIEYGTMPDAPDDVNVEIIESNEIEGHIFHEKLHFTFIPDKSRPDVSFGVDAQIRYPFPDCLEDRKEEIPAFGKGGLPCMIYVGGYCSLELLDAGYIIINFENDQLDPMEMGNPIKGPAQKAYDALEFGSYSWGSISVWAWGARRMLDFALSKDQINDDQIFISGHSRNGKTALLAGALDERFALVCPAGSGCAGAGSYFAVGEGAETLASLTDKRRWWAWTHKEFSQYAYEFRGESKKDLPFDQHFVMALVAPRPILRMEGNEDWWANPEGTSCSFLATQPVFDFLGTSDCNQLFIRSGGHQHNHEDMMAMLSFANHYFFGIPQERIFKDLMHPINQMPDLFSWERLE